MCAGLKIVLKKLWIIKSVYIVEVHIKHISLTLPVLEGTGLCFYSIGFDCHGCGLHSQRQLLAVM